MVEPVTLTVAIAGRVGQAFSGVRKLYKGWKLTRSFGVDYATTWRDFQILCSRLELCSARKLGWLKKEFDPHNENDLATRAVLMQLANLELHFQTCHDLMKKYPETGR